MADATVTSVEVIDGVLHIYGTNFTQTTTTVYVDDVTTTASYVSATELTIDPAPAGGAEIVVEKAGVQSEPVAVPDIGAGTAGGTAEPGEGSIVGIDPKEPYPTGSPWSPPRENVAMNTPPDDEGEAA